MSTLIVEVCEIKSIENHPNADRLDIAGVKGWNCIVQRDAYKIGDWCVFFPPDSILPDRIINEYELEFLKKGGRVGTLKLRGHISQGLILPIDVLHQDGWNLGDNVTEWLDVKKYEPPAPKSSSQGNVTSRKVQNSNFTKYTDIENIQNFDTVFREGDLVIITEKIHGSNIRFGWLPIEINWKSRNIFSLARSLFNKYVLRRTHEFVYGSHNVQLQFETSKTFYAENIYARVLNPYGTRMLNLPKGYTFYGEVFGKGVQDLEYGLDGLALSIFDVKGPDGKYMDHVKMEKMCYDVGLTPVPWLHIGAFSLETLKNCTEGNSLLCDTQIREGCVVRPIEEVNHPRIGRKILKSINPEYLTRKNRTEYH